MTSLNLTLSRNLRFILKFMDLRWNLQIYIKTAHLNPLNLWLILQIYVKFMDFIEIHTSAWTFNRETS